MRYSVSDYWVYDFAKVGQGRYIDAPSLTVGRTHHTMNSCCEHVMNRHVQLAQCKHTQHLSALRSPSHALRRSGSAPRTTPTTWCTSSSSPTTLRRASRPSQVQSGGGLVSVTSTSAGAVAACAPPGHAPDASLRSTWVGCPAACAARPSANPPCLLWYPWQLQVHTTAWHGCAARATSWSSPRGSTASRSRRWSGWSATSRRWEWHRSVLCAPA